MNSGASAVFLDRDGVINLPSPEGLYITSPADFILLPGAAEAIVRLNQSGFRVIVVTNQRGIARGLVAAETVEQIHASLHKLVGESGGWIDHIYLCPHDYGDECECRKPKPGMLQQAARDYSLRLSSCWMVGDKDSDMQAGRAAGCHTVRVGGVHDMAADVVLKSLPEAVDHIVAAAGAEKLPE